jgi:hypothetical protein
MLTAIYARGVTAEVTIVLRPCTVPNNEASIRKEIERPLAGRIFGLRGRPMPKYTFKRFRTKYPNDAACLALIMEIQHGGDDTHSQLATSGWSSIRWPRSGLTPAANHLTNKNPRPKLGVPFAEEEALLLLATLLAALSGLLIRLLGLLTRLLLPATLLATILAALLVLLAALILIIVGHSYLQFFVKYCLNVIIQPTHFS